MNNPRYAFRILETPLESFDEQQESLCFSYRLAVSLPTENRSRCFGSASKLIFAYSKDKEIKEAFTESVAKKDYGSIVGLLRELAVALLPLGVTFFVSGNHRPFYDVDEIKEEDKRSIEVSEFINLWGLAELQLEKQGLDKFEAVIFPFSHKSIIEGDLPKELYPQVSYEKDSQEERILALTFNEIRNLSLYAVNRLNDDKNDGIIEVLQAYCDFFTLLIYDSLGRIRGTNKRRSELLQRIENGEFD